MATVRTPHAVKDAKFEEQHRRAFHGRFAPGMSKPKLLKRDERVVAAIGETFRPHQVESYGHAAEVTRAQPKRVAPHVVAAFHDLAEALRRKNASDARIAEIDGEMAPTDRDLVLTRRMPASAFGLTGENLGHLPELLAGRKISDRAYTPVALYQPDGPGEITMHITAPAGTPALVAGDNEYWLDRDMEFAVSGVYPNGRGGYTVEVTALPKTTPPAKKTAKAAAKRTPPAETPTSRAQRMNEQRARGAELRRIAQQAADIEELAANGASHEILKERAATMDPEIRDIVERSTPGQVANRIRRAAQRRGLTPVGRAGHVDKFDRATMTTVGDVADNGADVVIVRPGYTHDLGDGPAVVHRAQVVTYKPGEFRIGQRGRVLGPASHRPVPAKKAAPAKRAMSAKKAAAPAKRADDRPAPPEPGFPSRAVPELGDLMRSRPSETVRNHVRQAMGGTFGGLEARVGSVHHAQGSMIIQGTIHRPGTGQQVGSFVRQFDRKGGKLVATHEYLELDPTVQGSGFAREFNANLFDWYRRSGFDRVEIEANIDVGGYAWATQGFDFRDNAALDRWLQHARDLLEYFHEGGTPSHGMRSGQSLAKAFPGMPKAQLDAEVDKLRTLLAEAAGGRPVSVYEISQLGRQRGQGRDDMWIGKFILLGSSWLGALRL